VRKDEPNLGQEDDSQFLTRNKKDMKEDRYATQAQVKRNDGIEHTPTMNMQTEGTQFMSTEIPFETITSSTRNPPEPMYATDTKVLKLLIQEKPLDVPGTVTIDPNRKVVWKNLCMLGPHHIECVVEFSTTKNKFYVLVIDLFSGQYHVMDLWN